MNLAIPFLMKKMKLLEINQILLSKNTTIYLITKKRYYQKRVDFERYLTLIVNEEETVTLYIEKLKLRRKRAYKWKVLLFILTFGVFRAKKVC